MKNKIPIAIIVISILIVIGTVISVAFNKSNKYHVDVSNPNLIKTGNGYKEELVIDETTIVNKYINERRYRRFAPDIPQTYNIVYYNKHLEKNITVNVKKDKYNELNIGDKVKVIRIVYYTNNGLRLNYEDIIEKLK